MTVSEKDYWEGNFSDEEFPDALKRYGYEYTPLSQDIDLDNYQDMLRKEKENIKKP